MKKTRLILVGKSASGKDYARKICEEVLGIKYEISYTTRPPRKDEQHGVDYYFISALEFKRMIKEDMLYEYVIFNDWYYGTSKKQFYNKERLFIMSPAGLSHLSEQDRAESLVIYFDMPDDIRRYRMYKRKVNADSVERRIEADNVDFAEFTNYDVKITNPNFKNFNIYDIVSQYMDFSNRDKISIDNDGCIEKTCNLTQN